MHLNLAPNFFNETTANPFPIYYLVGLWKHSDQTKKERTLPLWKNCKLFWKNSLPCHCWISFCDFFLRIYYVSFCSLWIWTSFSDFLFQGPRPVPSFHPSLRTPMDQQAVPIFCDQHNRPAAPQYIAAVLRQSNSRRECQSDFGKPHPPGEHPKRCAPTHDCSAGCLRGTAMRSRGWLYQQPAW